MGPWTPKSLSPALTAASGVRASSSSEQVPLVSELEMGWGWGVRPRKARMPLRRSGWGKSTYRGVEASGRRAARESVAWGPLLVFGRGPLGHRQQRAGLPL